MKANLEKAIGFILADEGGYAQRAGEPGGAVNMGVSMASFTSWRVFHGRPRPSFDDLKAMTSDEAIAIYTTNYAEKIGFDSFSAGLDYALLDAAVNEGPSAAHGYFSVTIPIKDLLTRIKTISALRLAVKQTLPSWATYGAGWTARIGDRVVSRAKAMGNL